MQCANYKYLISQFIDGELAKIEEKSLFSHLAECEECRSFFKSANGISHSIQSSLKEFPAELESEIFNSIRKKTEVKKKFFFFNPVPSFALYAALAIIFALTVLLIKSPFSNEADYQARYRQTLKIIEKQNQDIEILLNSIPSVSATYELPNKVIVHSNL